VKLPFDAKPATAPDADPTFTYHWPAPSKLGREAGVAAYKLSGFVLIAVGIGLIVLGVTVVARQQRAGEWLLVGMGTVAIVIGMYLLTRRNIEMESTPEERLIRVHYEPKVIEFSHCPFWTGFSKRTVIESYLCPVEELKSYTFMLVANKITGSSRLRLWTSRGFLELTGDTQELTALRMSIELIAGKRPAPLLERTWVIQLIMLAIAVFVCAAAVYFKIV
jgi:hypothetical protein